MSEFTLTAVPALGGYDKDHDSVRLTELTDLAVVSVTLPQGGEAAAEQAIQTAFGIAATPQVGKSTLSGDGATRVMRLGRDQLFLLFTNPSPDAGQVISARLKGAAYITEQTDVWVALEISGPKTRAALERICPLDLNPDVFAIGCAARTAMEHLGTLILCIGPDRFILLSASSSAQSFLHALEVSIHNVR